MLTGSAAALQLLTPGSGAGSLGDLQHSDGAGGFDITVQVQQIRLLLVHL